MNAKIWFRVAAVLMLLFAAGHTFGFLSFRPSSAAGQAVWSAMREVHFTEGHSSFSYGNFYIGFGLSITASQLFNAWLAWCLSGMAERREQGTFPIAVGLLILELIGAALSLRYFSAGPVIFSLVAAGCFLMAILSLGRVRPSVA